MRRLLILGFSVTASGDHGYATPLRRRLAELDPELDVAVSGFGAATPHLIPAAFDHLQRTRGPFTHVLLEISTSAYAKASRDTPEAAQTLALDCLHRVAENGARPAVLHLFRTDLVGARLPFPELLGGIAEAHGYPVVDLAGGLVRRRGEAFAASLLRDVVHTTLEGAAYHAEEILAALAGWLRDLSPAARPPRPPLRRVGLPLAPFAEARGRFAWQQGAWDTALVPTEAGFELALEQPLDVFGLTFLYGPRTGRLKAALDDYAFDIDAHDEHSRFRRIGLRTIAPRPVRRLSVRQDPKPLPVILKRGEADPSPRLGELVELLHLVA